MKKQIIQLSLVAATILGFTGCASTNLQNEDEITVFKRNEEYGQKMANAVKDMRLHGKVLLASFVSANNLNETDGFGRITSDQVAGCLVQQGIPVIEVRLRHDNGNPEIAVSAEKAGEFAFSREMQKIAEEHTAELVISGVYTYGKYNTIVAMKAIDRDGIVRKAFNYTVPATVSFDWDKHSLRKFQEHRSVSSKNIYWDPYAEMDTGDSKVDFR